MRPIENLYLFESTPFHRLHYVFSREAGVWHARTLSCVRSGCGSAASATLRRVGGVVAAAAGWDAAGDAADDWLRVRQTAGGVGRPVVTRMLAARPRKKLLILCRAPPRFQSGCPL